MEYRSDTAACAGQCFRRENIVSLLISAYLRKNASCRTIADIHQKGAPPP